MLKNPCICRNYADLDSYAVGYRLVTGHHLQCRERCRRVITSTEVIEGLVQIVERERAEVARLTKLVEGS